MKKLHGKVAAVTGAASGIRPMLSVIAVMAFLFGSCQQRGSVGSSGMREISFEHGGRMRECLLHVPSGSPAGRRPLLLVLHGGGGTPKGLINLTKYRFNELADRDGFYAAYPSGLGKSWNNFGGHTRGYARRENIDDTGFISALIDRLVDAYPVDKNRVFAAGISNGGFMSYRLACELSGKLRGIAAVAATNPVGQQELCRPSSPVNVMIINGTEDPIVPYNGGDVEILGKAFGRVTSTDDTVAEWARINACAGGRTAEDVPDLDPADGTRVTRISLGPCGGGARVVLLRVEGGGHAWPGGHHYLPTMFIGRTSRDFNACDEIWIFFSGIR